MKEVAEMTKIHARIMSKLEEHKFCMKDQTGYYAYNQQDYNLKFNNYAKTITDLVEKTFKLWNENFEAGKGTPDQMLCFELGEPMLKSEF